MQFPIKSHKLCFVQVKWNLYDITQLLPLHALVKLKFNFCSHGDLLAETAALLLGQLKELTIFCCSVTDMGATALADALPFSTLLSLDLGNNLITQEGGSRLIKALVVNTELLLMDLSYNSIAKLSLSVCNPVFRCLKKSFLKRQIVNRVIKGPTADRQQQFRNPQIEYHQMVASTAWGRRKFFLMKSSNIDALECMFERNIMKQVIKLL